MKTLIATTLLKNLTIDSVKQLSQELGEPSWALDLRTKAFNQYSQLPWPSKNDERWKRTELSVLKWDQLSWSPNGSSLNEKIEATGEVRTYSLSDALQQIPNEIKQSWAQMILNAHNNKFMSLALALGSHGTCFVTQPNSEKSTQFKRTLSGGDSSSAHFVLNFILVDSNSQTQIWDTLEDEKNSTTSAFISNVTGIILKSNAQAHYYGLQHWNAEKIQFQFHDIIQQQHSLWNSIVVAMGGRIFHNESTVNLMGEGAQNKVLGILFGSEKQNFENWITQNHRARKTISDIQYRGALKGAAKSFFSGMVSIVKEAQQSDAFQSSKSMLLSTEARADAIPNLEILADDVKCSHGAAVGPVDEDQKFYLTTRGISPQDSEKMIIEGFFEPIIAEIPSEPVQEQLRQFIEEKLNRS